MGKDWLEENAHRNDYHGNGGPLDELSHWLVLLRAALDKCGNVARFRSATQAQAIMKHHDVGSVLGDYWNTLSDALARCAETYYTGDMDQKNADRGTVVNAISRLDRPPAAPASEKVGGATAMNEAAPSEMLTIAEAAEYCDCTERTIRNRLKKVNADGRSPMIAGVTGNGRLTRIPRASLEPYRKRPDETPKQPRKHAPQNSVKHKQ